MARQGYDDGPYIEAVLGIMAADTTVTRRQAIKAVVGDNASNIRRIEVKMTRLATDEALAATEPGPAPEPPVPSVPPAQVSEWAWVARASCLVLVMSGIWFLAHTPVLYAYHAQVWLQIQLLTWLHLSDPAVQQVGRDAMDVMSGARAVQGLTYHDLTTVMPMPVTPVLAFAWGWTSAVATAGFVVARAGEPLLGWNARSQVLALVLVGVAAPSLMVLVIPLSCLAGYRALAEGRPARGRAEAGGTRAALTS